MNPRWNMPAATPEGRRDQLARELANAADQRRMARRSPVPAQAPVHPVGDWVYEVEACRGSLDCWVAYTDGPVSASEHWRGHLRRYRVLRATPKRVYYQPRINPNDTRFTSRTDLESVGRSTFGRARYEADLWAFEPPVPENFPVGRHGLRLARDGAA